CPRRPSVSGPRSPPCSLHPQRHRLLRSRRSTAPSPRWPPFSPGPASSRGV
ncbi:MAG: hypothetical protein AVDCRST_MAG49-2163, partial [uncultured Thermomicrobiales bacterium]